MVSNPYERLGLASNATDDEIRAAYRRRAAQVHPDRQPAERKEWAAEQMRQLNAARDLLLDPKRRAGYDARFGRAATSTPEWNVSEPYVRRYPDMWSDLAAQRRFARRVRRAFTLSFVLITLLLVAALGLFAPHVLGALVQAVWTAGALVFTFGSFIIAPVLISLLLAALVISFRNF